MARPIIMAIIMAGALAACGQVITITMPGAVPGGGADGADPRRAGQVEPAFLEPLPEGYERLFSPTPYAFRFSGPGEPVRRGEVSERFELRPGDCGGSDCAGNRARAEIREQVSATPARLNRDIWYGYSFLNVTMGAASRETSRGGIFGQWKLSGDQPAIFRIAQQSAGEGNWAACNPAFCSTQLGDPADDMVIELEDMRLAAGWGPAQNNGAICRLFNMAQMRGQWVDIVINTNFANNSNGYLRVWVNGQLKCNYFGRLVSPQSFMAKGTDPSHRRGIFATNTRRWAKDSGAMVAYYDEFLTGQVRSDVDTRLRERMSARAKD